MTENSFLRKKKQPTPLDTIRVEAISNRVYLCNIRRGNTLTPSKCNQALKSYKVSFKIPLKVFKFQIFCYIVPLLGKAHPSTGEHDACIHLSEVHTTRVNKPLPVALLASLAHSDLFASNRRVHSKDSQCLTRRNVHTRATKTTIT